MPWLPIYMIDEDLKKLSEWLNSEKEIAIIKSVGRGKWRAFDTFSIAEEGRYCLFHKFCGPLPLIGKSIDDPISEVEDPFKGWKEKIAGLDSGNPFFGAGHPAIFWLNVSLKKDNSIGMSSFEWIGNRYGADGSPAPDAAKKWWLKLGRWVRKSAVKIPRTGKIDGDNPEIWAMENALSDIKAGTERAANPDR